MATRCRAELTALTPRAGFGWRCKPAGGTNQDSFAPGFSPSNPPPPCRCLRKLQPLSTRRCCWRLCVLRKPQSGIKWDNCCSLPTEVNSGALQRKQALPSRAVDAGRRGRSLPNRTQLLELPCTGAGGASAALCAGLALTLCSAFTYWDKKSLKIATGSETRGKQQTPASRFTQPSCNSISGQFYPLFNSI